MKHMALTLFDRVSLTGSSYPEGREGKGVFNTLIKGKGRAGGIQYSY